MCTVSGLEDKSTPWPVSWGKEHKAFVTLGIVMGAFLLCWLPFFLWYLTTTICGEYCSCPESIVSCLFWIGYFNSTLNPIIYVMTNQEFKKAFRNITKKILSCITRKDTSDLGYYDCGFVDAYPFQ